MADHTQPDNLKRRRFLQCVPAVTAIGIAPTIVLSGNTTAEVSGIVVSKIDNLLKTLVLRNHSSQPVTVSKFSNGSLMFDGEVFDCNGACLERPVSLAPGDKTLLQFDKRRLFSRALDRSALNGLPVNVQSRVTRLSEGTRVIPFSATVRGDVATLYWPYS
jgi:hypothetical protein